ncbi:magnesium transporter MgtE N-terminal domain-containing protein [Butyrivibrio sp. MC2013]|uniref:magnesium transporter MgtE N-terminal domain-containing protein n=1 Tax=Butyrivibrio sp. MC2013 TaxID=1280686 RepID=UPI000400B7FF|nr:hypothetical protein [Butyrivibrio sp. MC2013]
MADKKKKEPELPEYSLPDDPQEAIKKIKADRKQLKEEQKAARKQEKLRQKQMEEAQAELTGDKTAGLSSFLAVVLIVLLWVLLMAVMCKLNIAGLGELMRPVIGDVPYLCNLLPDKDDELPTPASSVSDNGIDEAYVRQLESELALAQSKNASLAASIETLTTEVARLTPFEEEQLSFEEDRKKFYEEIVYSDNAPDADAYASYYAMIYPDQAEKIYAEVVARQISDEEVKTYVAAFSAMDAENAANIFNSMQDLTLVARILNQMSSDDRGAILSAMNVDVADAVTELMEPENLPELSNYRYRKSSLTDADIVGSGISDTGASSSSEASSASGEASSN